MVEAGLEYCTTVCGSSTIFVAMEEYLCFFFQVQWLLSLDTHLKRKCSSALITFSLSQCISLVQFQIQPKLSRLFFVSVPQYQRVCFNMHTTAFLQAIIASVTVVVSQYAVLISFHVAYCSQAQNSTTPGVTTTPTPVVPGYNSTVPVNPGVPATSSPGGLYPNSSIPSSSSSVSYTTSIAVIGGVTTNVVVEAGATTSPFGSAPIPTDSGLPQNDGVAIGARLGMTFLSVLSVLVIAL